VNLFRKMLGLATKASRPLSLRDPEHWRNRDMQGYAGEHVDEKSVLALSAAWACVNLLAGTIASLPLMVYRTDQRSGARTVAREHPLYRVLHDSPNFDQTAVDFWEHGCAAVELQGNFHARIARTGARVEALSPIYAQVTARRLPNGEIRYSWSENGKSFDEPSERVFHVRGFGGDPLSGLSTLTYGRHTFSLAKAIDRAAGSTFSNGLRPSGVLTFASWLTAEQRSIAQDLLVEKFVGAVNAGRPLVLEGGTKWEQLTITPEDAQMLQSRGFSVEDICRFFGVPPFMVGHTEKSTSWGTGLEQQTLGFQKFTLRRRLKRIEQAAEKQLLTPADRAEGLTIEFNLEGLLRGDSAARASFYREGLTNGWMTINEVRALENLPPVAGGDVPRMQSQNIPITQTPTPAALPGAGTEDTP
jgi:HK97 family phage portal protein